MSTPQTQLAAGFAIRALTEGVVPTLQARLTSTEVAEIAAVGAEARLLDADDHILPQASMNDDLKNSNSCEYIYEAAAAKF
jgi:hypothetical protein